MGNLGIALIAYKGFKSQQFSIVAAFDTDTRKIGNHAEDVLIHNIAGLGLMLADTEANIAIISVPASAGIKCIPNFAPARLDVPKYIELHNVDLSIELDRLCYPFKNLC